MATSYYCDDCGGEFWRVLIELSSQGVALICPKCSIKRCMEREQEAEFCAFEDACAWGE